MYIIYRAPEYADNADNFCGGTRPPGMKYDAPAAPKIVT